jgi:hypothetical protein
MVMRRVRAEVCHFRPLLEPAVIGITKRRKRMGKGQLTTLPTIPLLITKAHAEATTVLKAATRSMRI